MPLVPRRLPRKFNRPTSKVARKYASKQRATKKRSKGFKWQRSVRRFQTQWYRTKPWLLRSIIIGSALLIVTVVCVLLFSPLIQVRQISIAKQKNRLDIAEVQQQLQGMFNRHLFFVTQSEVERLLVQQRDDVEGVTITKEYPDHLIVDIAVKPVTAALQLEHAPPPDENAPQQHYLTADGLYVHSVFSLTQSGEVLPLIHMVDYSEWPESGQYVVDQSLLEQMFTTETKLNREFGQEVTRRTVFVRAQEYHLDIGDRSLWFDIRSTAEEQLEKYALFLSAPIAYPVTEYIDLRLFNKVVWK